MVGMSGAQMVETGPRGHEEAVTLSQLECSEGWPTVGTSFFIEIEPVHAADVSHPWVAHLPQSQHDSPIRRPIGIEHVALGIEERFKRGPQNEQALQRLPELAPDLSSMLPKYFRIGR